MQAAARNDHPDAAIHLVRLLLPHDALKAAPPNLHLVQLDRLSGVAAQGVEFNLTAAKIHEKGLPLALYAPHWIEWQSERRLLTTQLVVLCLDRQLCERVEDG